MLRIHSADPNHLERTIMNRLISLAALALAACGIAAASPRPETSTYVSGNVADLKPNTGGTLVFSDEHAVLFRTGLAEVSVPYAGVSKAELGVTRVHSHDAPAYKVWALPARLHKTETQLLTLEFKSEQGEDRSMTFEIAKPAASAVLATIQEHTKTGVPGDAAGAKKEKEAWWGDSLWKTQRNASSWNGKN
jgi:hypothetical protein